MAESPWWLCKEAAVATIRALNLEGVGERVYNQIWPDATLVSYPCLLVTTEGEPEEIGEGTTEHTDRGYPVRVFFADRDAGERHSREPLYMARRDAVVAAFDARERDFRLRVPGAWKIEVRPRALFDPEAAEYKYIVGSLVLVFWHRRRKAG